MHKAKSPNGWSLNEGLAAQYAAQAGLDPDLAAPAGEAAWDVLKSLRDTVDEPDPARRAKYVRRTQQRLAKADLGRHRDLVRSIQDRLASLSSGNSAKPSVNPDTGLQEFNSYLKGIYDSALPMENQKFSNGPNQVAPPENSGGYLTERYFGAGGSDEEIALRIQKDWNAFLASREGRGPLSSSKFQELSAIHQAVNSGFTPSGMTISGEVGSPQQERDLFRLQDVDPNKVHLAPPVESSYLDAFTSHVPLKFRDENGELLPNAVTRMIAESNRDGFRERFFIDGQGVIRYRNSGEDVNLYSPLYGIVQDINSEYQKEYSKQNPQDLVGDAMEEKSNPNNVQINKRTRTPAPGGYRVPPVNIPR